MYEVYQQASRGDLAAIKKWLLNNLHKIDEAWDGDIPAAEIPLTLASSVIGVLMVTVGPVVVVTPPGAALALLGFFVFGGGGAARLSYLESYQAKHKGWTLLQFAAEEGAVEVARLLVESGASRTGKNNIDFLDIALKNGQQHFIDEWKKIEREWALELKAKNTEKENKILRDQIANQTHDIKKLQATISKQTDELTNLKYAAKIPNDVQQLKKEIISLNAQIQAYQDYKNKSQDVILQLVGKYEKLLKLYKEKVDASPPSSPKAPQKATPAPLAQKPETKKDPIAENAYEYGMIAKKYIVIAGDCFIDSVIINQGSRKWSKRELRDAISKELKDNRKEYEWTKEVWKDVINPYGFKYSNYEEYCSVIAKDTCSLSELEIQAFVNTKKVCCVILEMGEPETLIFGSEYYSQLNPPIFIGHYGDPLTETGHYVPLDCPATSLNTVLQKIIKDKNNKTGKLSDGVPGIFSKIPGKAGANPNTVKGPECKP